MESEDLLRRITINPNVCFGKPIIRDMRYPVEMILDLLSAGMTNEEILADYESLEEKDIHACLLFAAEILRGPTATAGTGHIRLRGISLKSSS